MLMGMWEAVTDQCVCPLSRCEEYVGSNHISKEIENFPTKINQYKKWLKYQTTKNGKKSMLETIDRVIKRQNWWNGIINDECKPENCLDSYKNYSK
jgi:hypothetical protein